MRYRLMIVMLLCLLAIVPTFAQSDEIVISLAVREYQADDYRELIIPQFEAENPGIRVHIDTTGGYSEVYWHSDPEWYLDSISKLAHQTDVFVVNQALQRDATRAGYILDLAPLVRSDMSINQADYLPNAWESFSWEGGIWAIPSFLDVYLVLYDREAFDQAGLSYPDGSWDVYDYSNAIRSLSTLNPDGTVDQTVIDYFYNSSQLYFYMSLLNRGIYDDTGLQLDQASIEPIISEWQSLIEAGYFNVKHQQSGSSGVVIMSASGNSNKPLTILPSTAASFFSQEGDSMSVAPLPNNYSGIEITGYAVSSGTLYPDAAYKLAKFLADNPLVIRNEFLGRPANTTVDVTDGAEDGLVNLFDILNPDVVAQADQLFNNIRSASEQHFFDLLLPIIMGQEGSDDVYTLDDVSAKIEERFRMASERANTPVTVNPPPQKVEIAPGQIELKFSVAATMSPFPYREQWETFISEFLANEPTIGHIDLNTGFMSDLESMVERYDCFYSPYGTVLSNNPNLSLLLSIDPYLSADSNNVLQDVIRPALERLQIDGQTWAFPITVEPQNLSYKPEMFQQANAGDPLVSWTISDFENALWALKGIMEDDKEPFQPMLFETYHLYLLIMAYGGNPFDFSTTPPTLSFSDEATINATKQVLDLARNGLMAYTDLGQIIGSMSFSSDDSAPLSTSMMGNMGMTIVNSDGEVEFLPSENYPIPYPSGSLYTPVHLYGGSAYISATTQYADECYRFIRAISEQPNLFIGEMPALKSVINSPDLVTAHGQANVDFYKKYAEQLEQPNTFILPAIENGYSLGSFTDEIWFYRVFDEYVKNGDQIDLVAEFADAQEKANEHRECISNIEIDIMTIETQEEYEAYLGAYEGCLQQIDPSISLP